MSRKLSPISRKLTLKYSIRHGVDFIYLDALRKVRHNYSGASQGYDQKPALILPGKSFHLSYKFFGLFLNNWHICFCLTIMAIFWQVDPNKIITLNRKFILLWKNPKMLNYHLADSQCQRKLEKSDFFL